MPGEMPLGEELVDEEDAKGGEAKGGQGKRGKARGQPAAQNRVLGRPQKGITKVIRSSSF